MSESYEAQRAEAFDAVGRIVRAGLVTGASGNVSRRIPRGGGDLMAVTASRVPYDRFTIDDVLVVDLDIEPAWGEGVPSSESLMHAAIYRARPDAGAVIHTHSVYASAFAAAGRPIPVVLDEQVLALGGAVEVAAYASSASEELAEHVVAALGECAAALLRNHGVVGVGANMEEAIAVVELVERVAQIVIAAGAIGGARELGAEIVREQQGVYRMMKGFRG
jgi:L-fuculose-phosphate aldolase